MVGACLGRLGVAWWRFEGPVEDVLLVQGISGAQAGLYVLFLRGRPRRKDVMLGEGSESVQECRFRTVALVFRD